MRRRAAQTGLLFEVAPATAPEALTREKTVALKKKPVRERLPLDNNAAGRALRPIALGRRNWLFAGSVRGGEAAAIVLSFIESAKLHGLNPMPICAM